MNLLARLLTLCTALALLFPLPAGAAGDTGRGHPDLTAGDTVRLIVHRDPGSVGPLNVRALQGVEPVRDLAAINAQVVAVPAAAADRLTAQLEALPGVELVERDAVVHILGDPDDPLWEHQWGMRRVGMLAAWERFEGWDPDDEEAPVIAVLDTGVNAIPDLAGRLLPGKSFIESSNNTSDPHGHGTVVAEIAAARGDNGQGMAGACWECRILPGKVLNQAGGGHAADVAAGITWAAAKGADVINLSLGTFEDTKALRDAVADADSKGAIVVAAAGNAGSTELIYPAALPKVIGVGSSGPDDQRAPWSSHGPWVDLAAPGCHPTVLLGDPPWPVGTSFSAPVVAGTAALALALPEEPDREEVIEALRSTASGVDYVEHGRLRAGHALADLADEATPQDPPVEDVPSDVCAFSPGLPDDPTLLRLAGPDRFSTAVEISQAAFPPGVWRVYLARGDDYPDALAAGATAGAWIAPVLLTGRDRLPDVTRDELARLDPLEVVAVGGTAAISDEVMQAASQAANAPIKRLAGQDRFGTAAAIAVETFAAPASVVYVATGHEFADALAGVPAAVLEGGPVLLTATSALPDPTKQALSALDPDEIVVLGGNAAVSAGVFEELQAYTDGPVIRMAGRDRFETATAVSEAVFPAGAHAAFLATGHNFPDALAVGPVAGLEGGPLLLVGTTNLPAVTTDELVRLDPWLLVVLGGTAVVSEDVADEAFELISD